MSRRKQLITLVVVSHIATFFGAMMVIRHMHALQLATLQRVEEMHREQDMRVRGIHRHIHDRKEAEEQHERNVRNSVLRVLDETREMKGRCSRRQTHTGARPDERPTRQPGVRDDSGR